MSGSDLCRKPDAFQEKRDFKLGPSGAGEIAQKTPWVLVQLGWGPRWVPAAAEQRTKGEMVELGGRTALGYLVGEV